MTTGTLQNDFDQARQGTGILLPYQARWAADRAPVKVMEKSRRIGISWGEAADSTLYASERGRGEKRNVWYIGYTKDMALEFINDCANWARAYNLAASGMEEYEEVDQEEYEGVVQEKKILAFRITFQSGWRITALSSRPSNLRGKQGRVIIDEAAFHDDLAGLLRRPWRFSSGAARSGSSPPTTATTTPSTAWSRTSGPAGSLTASTGWTSTRPWRTACTAGSARSWDAPGAPRRKRPGARK
jgi:hypothetical protein